jgi:hypothetical protein
MEEEYEEYVLLDEKGRFLTDEEGFLRIWYNKKVAEGDASYLSEKFGIKFSVVPLSFVSQPIPEERRVTLEKLEKAKEKFKEVVGE